MYDQPAHPSRMGAIDRVASFKKRFDPYCVLALIVVPAFCGFRATLKGRRRQLLSNVPGLAISREI